MTKVTVQNSEFVFSSALARHRFMEQAEGKEVKLEVQEEMTPEIRKYFEACIVRAFFYMHPHAGWTSFADAREVLKLEFSPFVKEVRSLSGTIVKIAPSTADLSKKRMTMLVDAVTEWMLENGVNPEVLDSEAYKFWRDTNFDDPIYPPIARMKQKYYSERISPAL